MKSEIRTRISSGGCVVCAMVLGMGIRGRGEALPRFIRDCAPDALWAMMVFFLIVFLWPRLCPVRAAVGATLFSFAIEASQLLQFGLLRELRATTLGALVLGHGFLWSDIACYVAGIALGYTLHRALLRTEKRIGIRLSR